MIVDRDVVWLLTEFGWQRCCVVVDRSVLWLLTDVFSGC